MFGSEQNALFYMLLAWQSHEHIRNLLQFQRDWMTGGEVFRSNVNLCAQYGKSSQIYENLAEQSMERARSYRHAK